MKSILFVPAFLLLAAFSLHAQPQIQWEPHPIELDDEIKDRVRFGFLPVPENRNNPDSREIYMAFTVIESVAENPLPDPFIIVPGGPGFGFNQLVNQIPDIPLYQDVLEKRDLILIDIRGSGYSHPRLCENMDTMEFRLQSTFFTGAELEMMQKSVIAECAELIHEAGAEITAYNSVEAAHDIEALRLALGYEQWNVRGHSYGSRHSMTLMQQYPETVRSALLGAMSGYYRHHDKIPVYLARSIRIMLEYCEADQNCRNAYPELESDLIRLITGLETDPAPLPAFFQKKIGDGSYAIEAGMLLRGSFTLLYDKEGIEITPMLIHQLAEGNSWIAQNLALSPINTLAWGNPDMTFIIINNDIEPDPYLLYPGERDELAAFFLNYLEDVNDGGLKRFWPQLRGANQATPEVWDILDIPTLLISGELDPICPPSHGYEFTKYFTNYAHYVIPGSGHYPHTDAQIDYIPFLDNPDPADFDIEAHMEVKPLQFVTDVYLNRGLSSTFALVGAGQFQRLILPGIAILFCLFGFAWFPVRGLVRRIRKKPGDGRFREVFIVWMVCLLSVSVLALFFLAVMDAMSINPYILAIGLPGSWSFIKAVTFLLFVFVVMGNILIKSILKSSAGVKYPAIISLTGGLGFSLFLLFTGMV